MLYYGLLLLLVLEYLRPASLVPGLQALRLNTFIPLGVVLATLVAKSPVTNGEIWSEGNSRLLLFVTGLVGVSVLTADLTRTALNVFTTVLGYVLLAFVVSKQITSRQRMVGVFKTLIFVHVAVAALTPEMFTDTTVRHYLAAGLFGDGNDFALSVNVVIPFCLFLVLNAPKARQRLLYAGILLLLIFCVIATRSRGGTIALVCLGLYYWMNSDRKVVTGLIGVSALVTILLLAPAAYFNRMTEIADTEEGSAKGRILAWTAGMKMAMDHPILGVGAGHFPVKYGVEYRPPGYGVTEIPWQTAHSIYFLILGELGFPGLAALVGFIGWNLLANHRFAREIKARGLPDASDARLLASLSASLVAFAAGGAFLSAVYYPHLYLLSGLLTAGRRLVRDRQPQQQPQVAVQGSVTTLSRNQWAERRRLSGRAR